MDIHTKEHELLSMAKTISIISWGTIAIGASMAQFAPSEYGAVAGHVWIAGVLGQLASGALWVFKKYHHR